VPADGHVSADIKGPAEMSGETSKAFNIDMSADRHVSTDIKGPAETAETAETGRHEGPLRSVETSRALNRDVSADGHGSTDIKGPAETAETAETGRHEGPLTSTKILRVIDVSAGEGQEEAPLTACGGDWDTQSPQRGLGHPVPVTPATRGRSGRLC